MIYAFLAALVFGAVAGFYGGYNWESGRWAKAEEAQHKAEAQVEAAAKDAEKAAANAITDMEAAYQVGEEKGRSDAQKVGGRVRAQIATAPVFQNPACTLPQESFALLTATLKGVRAGVVMPTEGSPAATAPPVAAPPATTGRPPKPVPKKKATP
jgi:hypothetical protein